MIQAAKKQYREQKRVSAEAVGAAGRAWRRMSASDLDLSWQTILPGMMAVVMAAQERSSELGADYIHEVRNELNITGRVEGEFRPSSLTGAASTGIPLEDALGVGVIETKRLIKNGVPVLAAMRLGGVRFQARVQTEVADAGRVAASVSAMADKSLTLYTRMLVPPSCSRCALLAGARYKMSEAFARHPQCDCRHVPCNEDTWGDLTTDPQEYFDSLSEAEQDKIFTKAGARAIRDGADMNQVVNARRGMYTTKAGNLATRAGSSRRGLWGSSQIEVDPRTGRAGRAVRRDRIMPETIYSLTDDRDEQIRLLKYYRFII